MKLKANTAIERKVAKSIRAAAKGRQGPTASSDLRQVIRETLEHGCSSGCVPEMIYHRDTLKFFARHKAEINDMLTGACNDSGCGVGELLRDYDTSDVLCLSAHNQNLLAWFAWETATRTLADRAGIEV